MLSSVLLLLTMCVSGYADGLQPLSQSVITALLSGHNQLRSPLNLPDLVWNSTLASSAGSHSGDCYTMSTGYSGIDKKRDSLQVTKDAFAKWSKELTYVDPKWSCISQWFCRSYSQLVWRKTKSVGCAIFHCSIDVVLLGCEYYPQGNINGEMPY